MTTELLIIFLSSVSGLFVGLAISNVSAKREDYFCEIVNVIERIVSDIRFTQEPIERILYGYCFACEGFKKNVDEYLDFVHGKTSNLAISRGLLTKREHTLVCGFFERLGTLDLDTQIGELRSQLGIFSEIYSKIKQKNVKINKAYLKIGFLSGLLVGILLL